MKTTYEPQVGDIIEYGGKERVVFAVRPTHRTYNVDEPWPLSSNNEGLTFINDGGFEEWCFIENVKFIRRPEHVGRKAIVTRPGKTYSTYADFAKKHGFPDALCYSPSRDEKVTVIASGPHSTLRKELYIVQNESGRRFIIGSEGIEFYDEMPSVVETTDASVTVLADESLGGVKREYREVKRKANVGELVRVEGHPVQRQDGIHTVTHVHSDGHVYFEGGGRRPGGYVVLEPTDVIHIDDVRYRMVEHKANVGETIIVTRSNDSEIVGKIGVCTRNDEFDDGSIDTSIDVPNSSTGFIDCAYEAYAVLERLEPSSDVKDASYVQVAESNRIAALEAQVDGLTETVAKLTTQLRVAREDIKLVEEGVADDIETLKKRLAALETRMTPVTTGDVAVGEIIDRWKRSTNASS